MFGRTQGHGPFVLCLGLAACGAQPETPASGVPDAERLRPEIERLLAEYRVPGASLAYLSETGESWTAGYGEMEAGGPRADETTIYEVASLAKPVFAYVVMRLVEDGALDLDAPLADYLPEDHADREMAQRLTGRMALNHTTGLPNRGGRATVSLQRQPGESWSYSGYGYVLLQHAIEELTGQDLNTLATALVFQPLEMNSSSYLWREELASRVATGHDRFGDPLVKWKPDEEDMHYVGAMTSLHTSAEDMERFLRAAVRDSTTLAMMQETVPVAPDLGLTWGLGWAVEELEGRRYLFQWGANSYFRAFLMVSPEEGTGLALLTNGQNGLALTDDIVERVTGTDHPLFRFFMLHPN